jgi:DNA-binding transcriptional MerR regulator
MASTVKMVARLAGVSIRMLHCHYAVRLLLPAHRSPAGYRLYEDSDLARRHQVLFFRELDFGIPGIKELIGALDFDAGTALRQHRELLQRREAYLARLIRAIDRTLEGMAFHDPEEVRTMFDGFDQAPYAAEVRERWGHTHAYRESQERTRHHPDQDWRAVASEQTEILRALAQVMDRGFGPDHPTAREVAPPCTDSSTTTSTNAARHVPGSWGSDRQRSALYGDL